MDKEFKARRFFLLRIEDVSGVSGTGKVAEGVEFENGMVALSFSSAYPHTNVYANMRAVEEVHGHEGATKIVFVDHAEVPVISEKRKRKRTEPADE